MYKELYKEFAGRILQVLVFYFVMSTLYIGLSFLIVLGWRHCDHWLEAVGLALASGLYAWSLARMLLKERRWA